MTTRAPPTILFVMQRKPRVLDFVIVLLLISAGIFLTVRAAGRKSARVIVRTDDGVYEYSANTGGIYAVQGRLGKTFFEISDGKVRITDSPCPNKTCVNQLWRTPLVCLPNNVIITLESDGDFDAIAE